MNCPKCDGLIRAEDANLEKMVACCRRCDEFFRFDQDLKPRLTEEPRPALQRPARLVEERHGSAVSLSWSSGEPPALLVLAFLALYLGGTAVWMFLAMRPGTWGFVSAIPVASLSLFGVCVLGLLAERFYRTKVVIGDSQLAVRYRPLPGFGNLSVRKDEIRQLYCERARNDAASNLRTAYSVYFVDTSGRIRHLLADLDENMAYFIKERLEKELRVDPNLERRPPDVRRTPSDQITKL